MFMSSRLKAAPPQSAPVFSWAQQRERRLDDPVTWRVYTSLPLIIIIIIITHLLIIIIGAKQRHWSESEKLVRERERESQMERK